MSTRLRPRAAHALTALLLTLPLAGCSKPPPAKTGPLVTAPAPQDEGSSVRASLTVGATQSKYTAHLQNGRIASIDETRTMQDSRLARGTYSFYEARLVKYSGDGFASSGRVEVEFDLHGAIKQSHSDAGTLGVAEIDAIRNRAELLRSHALTQQAVQAHQLE